MVPFITGSHAYGTPHAKSDIDLVLPPINHKNNILTDNLLKILIPNSDLNQFPIRFGKLNLIVPQSIEEYRVWYVVTKRLIRKSKELNKPITRDKAVTVFQTYTKRWGPEDMFSTDHSNSETNS